MIGYSTKKSCLIDAVSSSSVPIAPGLFKSLRWAFVSRHFDPWCSVSTLGSRARCPRSVLSIPERGLGRRETRGSDGVRGPHSTDGVDDVTRRIHPPDPQPRQAVGLGERAQHDDVPARIDEVESSLAVRADGKLGVCLFASRWSSDTEKLYYSPYSTHCVYIKWRSLSKD